MKVLQVTASLELGGAETVAVRLANGFAERGDESVLMTLDAAAHGFEIHPQVVSVRLGLAGGGYLRRNLRRIRAIRRELRALAPDVVISHLHHVNNLCALASIGLPVRLYVMEHGHVPATGLRNRISAFLRGVLYRVATKTVAASATLARELRRVLPTPHVVVINNPVAPQVFASSVKADLGDYGIAAGKRVVCAMGRLHPVKGFDLLIEAFAVAGGDQPDWDLLILGEGGERRALEATIERFGLSGRVHMPGAVENPFPALRAAGMFVMSSHHEGFPLALVEAMGCGLPVVTFGDLAAADEITPMAEQGLRVKERSAPSLADEIARLMADGEARKRYGAAAAARARDFTIDAILDRWYALFSAG